MLCKDVDFLSRSKTDLLKFCFDLSLVRGFVYNVKLIDNQCIYPQKIAEVNFFLKRIFKEGFAFPIQDPICTIKILRAK